MRIIPCQGTRAAAAAALVLLVVAGAHLPRAAQSRPQEGGVLRFGFSAALLDDVSPSDAMAAMVLWVRAVGKTAGVYRDAEATVFPDLQSVLTSANSVDLFAMSSAEYLSAERSLAGDPCMAYMVSGEVETEYLLLARTGTASLSALRGARLAVQNHSGQRRIADVWLDVLLMESGVPERERFWGDTKTVTKATQAILPVYFGQMDAAMVTRSSFETVRELNPDVGRKLAVVARSPKLLPGLICARRSLPADLRQRYVQSATTIHENPQFKQTFMVLRMNRLVAWEPRFLDAARAVLAQYQALRRRK